MGISYTPVWVHGNAMKYNQNEVNDIKASVRYTSDGFEITPPPPNQDVPNPHVPERYPRTELKIFLPITAFPTISNAVTKVANMILKYDIPSETGANISELRLIQANNLIYPFKNLIFPLSGPFLDAPVQDRNVWSPSSLKIITNDGNLGLCIEITISFISAPEDNVSRIIIGGGGVSLEHTKFKRD